MRSTLKSAPIGFGLGASAIVALGVGLAQPGSQQAAPPLPSDPVRRELVLLSRGLFREDSKLPVDRGQSIEQMLATQSESLARLSSRLSMLDANRLDTIERRLASLERTLDGLDTSQISDLKRDISSLERSVGTMSRNFSGLPRTDLSSIQRTLDDIRRQVGQSSPSGGGGDGDLREIKSTLRSIENQLRSIERKLP